MTISGVTGGLIEQNAAGDPRGIARVVQFARSIYRLVGSRISIMFFATIPTGLLLGALEIVIAFAFYLVLVKFHLVTLGQTPTWIPGFIDPVALLIIVMLVGTGLRYAAQVLPGIANSAFFARVREALVHATLNRPGEGATLSVAEVSLLSETVSAKAGGFIQGTTSLLSTTSLLVLVSAQLIYLSWELTAIAFLGAGLVGLPILALKPLCGRFADRQYKILQAFTYRFLKDVRNAHFLKICGLSGRESTQVGQMTRDAHANATAYGLLNGITISLPSLAGALLILSLLWLNEAWSMMPAASLVPFIYLLNRAIGSLATLSTSHSLMRECLPYIVELSRFDRMLFPDEVAVEHSGGAVGSLQKLEVRNLTFGRTAALTPPLSFDIKRGEMVLISGPSGRGKTTLLLTFLGLIPTLSGSVKWNGAELNDVDPVDLRHKIGFASPEPYLVDADIRTNLMFGLERKDVSDSEIERALKTTCADFVFDLAGGLAHPLREHGDGISAGQKQRLALARCLLRRPEVLFLDEATANIDEATEKKFFENIFETHRDIMIIAVSHRSSLRQFATHVVTI